MADGLIPSEGIALQLECILKRSISGVAPWKLILFVNDIDPDEDTVLADLVEATWGGYSPVTLDRANWTPPNVTDGCAVSTWGTDALLWYVTSGPLETNYGYAMYSIGTGKLAFIQRFDDTDIEPVAVGGRVSLLPRYTLTSCACS